MIPSRRSHYVCSTNHGILNTLKRHHFVHKLREELRFQQQRWHFRKLFREKQMGEAFERIYSERAWGSVEGEEFFSGDGSLEEFAAPYVKWVNGFVKTFELRRLVDLGCGDFRVGKLIDAGTVKYIGIDVAPNVIRHNQKRFEAENVEFRCANIIEEELPDGDISLIRQVLQHLSNEQILKVLRKCEKYPYVVVTEDIYAGKDARPNVNKEAGWETRLFHKSGVFVELPPFNYVVENIIEIPYRGTNILRTVLITNESAKAKLGDRRWGFS